MVDIAFPGLDLDSPVGSRMPQGLIAEINSVLAPFFAGKADLSGGKLLPSQVPSIALQEFLGSRSTQAAMLLLNGERGDWCYRSDLGTDWQLIAEPSSVLANWQERHYPASPVSSVAGRVGAITLSKADIAGIDRVNNTNDAEKPISDLTQAALTKLSGIKTPAWIQAINRRMEKAITIATFADSRGDGTKPVASTGVQANQVFTQELSNQIRGALGLPIGGRGYLPMMRSGADNTYQYAGPSVVAGAAADITADTGLPGSQWIVPGRTIRVPLLPGTTSVDLISSLPGGGVHYVQLTGQSGASYQDSATVTGGTNTDLVQFTKLNNPGTYVDVTSPGGGWQALGMIEYANDETSGVRSFNFAVAGIPASDWANYVTKAPLAGLIAKIVPDMTIVEAGANDIVQGRTGAQVVASIQAIFTASGGEKIGMTIPVPSTYTANATPVNAAIRGITNAIIVDYAALGADASATAYSGWWHTDMTHLTRTGNIAFADALRRVILGPFTGSISNVIQAILAKSIASSKLADNIIPCDFTMLAQSGIRATGRGDMPEGVRMSAAGSISAVNIRIGTAGASGNTIIVQMYKNGAAVAGATVTVTTTNAGANAAMAGMPIAFAAGDLISFNVNTAEGTPGQRLYADVVGTYMAGR